MVSFEQAIPSTSYYGKEIRWDFRQQKRDEELEIDGESDVDLPLIDKVVNNH